MNKQDRNEKIENFLRELKSNIEIMDYIDVEDVNSFDDIVEQLEDRNGFQVDIIYYSEAIKYLAENDASLRESIELAIEYGYELSSLNSEVLASIHASSQSREIFNDMVRDKIEDFLTNWKTKTKIKTRLSEYKKVIKLKASYLVIDRGNN